MTKFKAVYTIPGKIWEGDFIVEDAYSKDDAIVKSLIKCQELEAIFIDIVEVS